MTRTLAAVLLMTSHLAYGACSKELIVSSSGHLGHAIERDELENHEPETGEVDLGFYACKMLPNQKNLAVITLATVNDARTKTYDLHADGGAIYDLIVAVVDTKTDKQIAKNIISGALESNAVALRSLEVDTGRYYLEKGSVVFGVRSYTAANSHSYIYDEEKLFLYKLRRGNLAVVLRGLDVKRDSGNIEEHPEDTVIQHSKSILSVAPHVTNGMHDLEVIEKNSEEMPEVGESGTARPVTGGKLTLKYDGNEYSNPKH